MLPCITTPTFLLQLPSFSLIIGNINLFFSKILSFDTIPFYKHIMAHTFLYPFLKYFCIVMTSLQGSQGRLPYFRPVNRFRDVKWLTEGHMFNS